MLLILGYFLEFVCVAPCDSTESRSYTHSDVPMKRFYILNPIPNLPHTNCSELIFLAKNVLFQKSLMGQPKKYFQVADRRGGRLSIFRNFSNFSGAY